jgi:hypothetical protein
MTTVSSRSRPHAHHTARIAALALAGVMIGVAALPAAATADPISTGPDFAVVPGARPDPATATIPTWRDTFTDPTNGVRYGVDIVGRQDPRTPGAGTTTVKAEIIPVDLSFEANGGQSFNGSNSVQAVVHSPIFQGADYSAFSNNVGVQYLDAVMRSQFNQVGNSPFHLELQPNVQPPLQLSVPKGQGEVEAYPNGAQYGCVAFSWLYERMWSAIGSRHISPTTLPIFLSTWVRGGYHSHGVCVPYFIGIHGAGTGGALINGTSAVIGQTWMEVSYDPANIRPSTPDYPGLFKDIDALGHEIAEWADDPYAKNTVQPYSQPNSVRYGFCDNLLETGDPVTTAETSLPGNTYFQNLPGNDGTWTVQDEVFLPWFARESPNLTSEPEASSGFGRYTFFGDLDPNPALHRPAAAC